MQQPRFKLRSKISKKSELMKWFTTVQPHYSSGRLVFFFHNFHNQQDDYSAKFLMQAGSFRVSIHNPPNSESDMDNRVLYVRDHFHA